MQQKMEPSFAGSGAWRLSLSWLATALYVFQRILYRSAGSESRAECSPMARRIHAPDGIATETSFRASSFCPTVPALRKQLLDRLTS